MEGIILSVEFKEKVSDDSGRCPLLCRLPPDGTPFCLLRPTVGAVIRHVHHRQSLVGTLFCFQYHTIGAVTVGVRHMQLLDLGRFKRGKG